MRGGEGTLWRGIGDYPPPSAEIPPWKSVDERGGIVEDEFNRLVECLRGCGVDDTMIEALRPVIENVAYMKDKLDGARDAIKNSNVAIAYDNGGGQKGIRENPLYKGYEALWKSYLAGMKMIIDAMPECAEKKTEEERPVNMLQMIRAKKTG